MARVSADYLHCRNCGAWYARRRLSRAPFSPEVKRQKIPKKPCRDLSKNPYCVICRVRMKSAGSEKGRRTFRCGSCGSRAIFGTGIRSTKPAEHVASCLNCHRNLVTAGKSRQYLRCLDCGYLVKREGVKEARRPRQHLASCVGCRQPFINSPTFFYCPRCHWAASVSCKRQRPLSDECLPAFVSAYVPRDLPREIREEVEVEIVLALLKTRRAGNGYGLTTKRMSPDVVQQFVKKAWRNRRYQHWELSIDDSEHSLAERFAG